MFRSPPQVELARRKLPKKNGERQTNDSDAITTKRQPAYSNHEHSSAVQTERSASKEPRRALRSLKTAQNSRKLLQKSAFHVKHLPNRPNVTMFASANRMLCRVLNRQGVLVACVVFLSGRTYEEGGSERGIHYQRGAEFRKMAETTACRRFLRGEHNIKPRNRRWLCRGEVFCVRKVGFDVSILICVRFAVFLWKADSFLLLHRISLPPSST